MQVYKCDRCGAVFEYDRKVRREFHIRKDIKDEDGWTRPVDVDLCPKCYDKLREFLTGWKRLA